MNIADLRCPKCGQKELQLDAKCYTRLDGQMNNFDPKTGELDRYPVREEDWEFSHVYERWSFEALRVWCTECMLCKEFATAQRLSGFLVETAAAQHRARGAIQGVTA